MFKKYWKNVLVGLVIFLLIIAVWAQYEENKKYESYLSSQLDDDLITLVRSIHKNYEITEEIISSGEITKQHGSLMLSYVKDFLIIIDENKFLAKTLDESEGNYYDLLHNGNDLFSFVFSLTEGADYELEEIEDTLIPLDDDLRRKIDLLNKLYAKWSESTAKYIVGADYTNGKTDFNSFEYSDYYGNYSITNDFWLKYFNALNKKTIEFLEEQNVSNLDELLE